ncbi:flagellar biosynthetic protein FliO [Plesiomonas shigelloides subsp. oncorhynchi]|nr:flagellar biosynthetic protein FliO [Plesiomonas shigelloides]
MTPQSISLLKELGDAPENHANPPSGFQQQLNALLENASRRPSPLRLLLITSLLTDVPDLFSLA